MIFEKNEKTFNSATEAVEQLQFLYNNSINNLQKAFKLAINGSKPDKKIQEFYPQISIKN